MRELLRPARFRAFWLGQATGVGGDGLTLVALPLTCAAAIGAGVALQVPADRAALPQLVPEPVLPQANALDAATQTPGQGVGAGIGGVLVTLVGVQG